jgi:cyanophycin synthetase
MPRPVGRAIVDHLFPEEDSEGKSGRIDIVGIAGSVGTHTMARLMAWLLHLSGRRVGLACRDGLFLGSRQIDRSDGARWEAGHRLLMNRSVDAVVIENGAPSVLNDGLAYDRCHVGLVTDLTLAPHDAAVLATHDVYGSDQLVKVLRTQVDVVTASGVAVLNAADPRIADMASLCDGEVIFYARDGGNEALVAHRATGGRGVFLRDGWAVLAAGSAETVCANVDHASRRFAVQPHAMKPVADPAEVLLASIASAWALGISHELMAAGIETFPVAVTTGVIAAVQTTADASPNSSAAGSVGTPTEPLLASV